MYSCISLGLQITQIKILGNVGDDIDTWTPWRHMKTSSLREYDTVGIAKWFFHENSCFGQFRHALSKYAKKNIPSWLSFRDIYDRISTIFQQIFKIRIFIAVKKIWQFQNGKR